MKKHILRTLVLFCCLLSLGTIGTLSVLGQQLSPQALCSKVSEAMEKDPKGDVSKALYKKYSVILLDRWDEKEKIPTFKTEMRNDFEKFYRKSPDGYLAFIDVLFDEIKGRYAQSSAVPALQYNLVLLAGELEASIQSGGTTDPYVKSRSLLKECAASDKAYLRIAGLKGLARHAAGGLKTSEDKADFAKIFVPFAFAPLTKGEANEAPETEWCRLLALTALGDVGYAGKNGEIAVNLLKSAETQNKQITSPLFRHDMERRITAARAFSKIQITPDVLKAIGKKPADITLSLGKLFLQCMIYEHDHDYDLQEGIEGEETRNVHARAIPRVMTPEEELYQIRLWKQRTKAISSIFFEIFRNKQSSLAILEANNPDFRKIANMVREITEMYDSLGLSKKRASTKTDEMGDPNMMSPDVAMGGMSGMGGGSSDEKISLYKLQKDMRMKLNDLAELLKIEVKIAPKRRSTSEMGF